MSKQIKPLSQAKQQKILKLQSWIKLLEETKNIMPRDRTEGVCITLIDAQHNLQGQDNRSYYDYCYSLKEYISRKLGGKPYITSWLRVRCPEFNQIYKKHKGTHTLIGIIQQYRADWIDHMINDFQRYINEYKEFK